MSISYIEFIYDNSDPQTFVQGAFYTFPQQGVGGEAMWLVGAYVLVGEPNHVYLEFSNEVRQDTIMLVNFGISATGGGDARTINSLTRASTHVIRLNLDGNMTADSEYTVSVQHIYDTFSRLVDPSRDTATVFGLPLGLVVDSVTALDSTHVRINFSAPVLDNDALHCADVYHLTRSDDSRPLTIYEIVPEAVTNPNYVVVTVDEQQDGLNYNCLIDRIEAA